MYYGNKQMDLRQLCYGPTIGGTSLSCGHDTCHLEVFNDFIQSDKGNISTVLKLGHDHVFQQTFRSLFTNYLMPLSSELLTDS
jgi:hypothetical protein